MVTCYPHKKFAAAFGFPSFLHVHESYRTVFLQAATMLSGNMATEAIRVFVNDVQHMVGLVAGRVEHGEVAIVTSFRGIQLAVLAVYCVAFAVLFAFVTKVLLPPVAALVSAEKNAPARQKCVVYVCGWPVSPCCTVFTMFHHVSLCTTTAHFENSSSTLAGGSSATTGADFVVLTIMGCAVHAQCRAARVVVRLSRGLGVPCPL